MSDSRKGKAGRLGDETRARINELKGGWGVPDDAPDEQSVEQPLEPQEDLGARPARRDASDDPTVIPADTADAPEPVQGKRKARKGEASRPPPLPSGARPKGPTRPPTGSASRTAKGPTKPPPLGSNRKRKAPTRPPPLPTGRKADATKPPPIRKAERAPSLPPPALVSAEGVDDDSPTARTQHDAPDGMNAGPSIAASGNASGTVRLPDSIPRRSGVVGDVAYVFRVLAKRRSSAIELAKIADEIVNLKEARAGELLQVARKAIGDDRNDQTLVGRAREDLLKIEEKRSLHAGRVAAAEEKMAALSRHRSDKAVRRTEEADDLDKEVERINASIEPLQTRANNARKRAGELRKHLRAIDEKIRGAESSLVAVTGPADKAAVHANIASMRAERDTVAADEPLMAAEIDDLDPKISSLISTRSGLYDKIATLDQERDLDEKRVQEKEVAVQASKAVESRAMDDQASKRQDALLELGEALHNKPVEASAPRASVVEKQDLDIGILERRRLELKELRNSVETFPIIMGTMWLLLLAASITAAVIFVTTRT